MRNFLSRHLAPIGRRLPARLRAPWLNWWQKDRVAAPGSADYQERIAAETAIFADQAVVHDLPAIYHYWSNRYLRPIGETFGFSHPDAFFALYLGRCYADSAERPARFVSLGCGNCDTEVRVARLLVDRGITDFTLECVDINAAMLERGTAMAAEAGVATQIATATGDFNRWRPQRRYAAVMANQSLHHVVELEDLFDAIRTALAPGGRFVASDMIGRNGHRLWPEAMAVLREYWQQLPIERRYNVQLRRPEPELEDWDCSLEGFEGIRAQDILPLLLQRFHFELFIGFANIIDPFIGRSFGPHLNADSAADRAFIDRVHARDEEEILAGRITPTHMYAVMRNEPVAQPQYWRHLTPGFCVRRVDSSDAAA